MAKVSYEFPIQSVSGKVCKHSNTILNNRQGTLYLSKRCNERTSPLTDAELAHRAKFAAAWQEVKNTLADPSKKAQALEGFKSQSKYKTLNGYIFAQAYADM